MSDTDDERLIQAILSSGVKIPPMPAILLRLNEVLRDEDAGPRELAALISQDGAPSGAVFRLVGSPVFGLRQRVETVEKAITVLGMRNASALIRTEILRGALHDPEHAHALEALWGRSGAIADLAMVALKTGHIRGIASDVAYTLGMFHDCGLALLCKRYPAYARALAATWTGNAPWPDIHALDREHHVHHALMGQMVARNWLLADDMVLAIRHHHDLAATGLPDQVARLCALFNFCCHLHHQLTGADDPEWEDGWREESARRLGFDDSEMSEWELEALAALGH
jgi:HD-like signal output (HDOD) protein